MRRSISLLVGWAALAGCRDRVGVDASVTSGQYTTADGENQVALRARLSPAWRGATVSWGVRRGVADTWNDIEVDPGPETTLLVEAPRGMNRYRAKHDTSEDARNTRLERQRIRFHVVATARQGDRELRSDTLVLAQDLIAAIRQEYLDIGLRRGAPPRDWFKEVRTLPPGLGYGDFAIAAANPEFMERLGRLERIWREDYELKWQMNSFYRNPAHNRYHVGGSGSGPVSNSWHQFGCAADLQTFPVLRAGTSRRADTLEARAFWNALAEEALALEFEVEPRDKNPSRPGASYSGVGHVHIEVDCIQ